MAEKGAGFDFTDAPFASASAQKAKGDEAKQDRAPPLPSGGGESRAQHHLKTKEEGSLKKKEEGRKEGPLDQRRYFLLFVYCSGLPGHPTTSLVEPPN
jgi:hypothetical protein